ncbi:hypothetical protein [Actibacterium sp. 188UL27-1]|uniref:hypothetical protein n=1 Tax=Actibacterium sp. 188UL27-1 TaxID=2786961 RepID=UPI00195BB365|nr:hypothetical protein [Actibacterium sp. 188UL27-1]MBM7068216.1 hypothetical protein [Actibacterium sp. 188UL27-1]
MTKPKSGVVFLFLVAILVAMGGSALRPGVFMIGQHEGDAMHLLEIVLRMADGDIPHVDFMTPLGALGFAPIVLFVEAGFGMGQATLWAQILVAALFLPAIWWVAVSRFSGVWPYVFGVIIVSLILAVVYGDAIRALTISMHYNRWAWAASFVVIACTMLASIHRRSAIADGLVVGALMSFLALTKMTYFAAFLPAVAVALLVRRQWGAIGVTVAVGVVAIFCMTALYGVSYWGAYIGDLLSVARSEVRPFPGDPFVAVLGAPAYIGGSLILLAGVVLLRQGAMEVEGLVLLLLAPGFFYVTFQNFGNDPQWLVLLGLLMFAALPSADMVNGWGWNMRQAVSAIGVAAIALSLPSMANVLYSPFRHGASDPDKHTAILAKSERHSDLMMNLERYYVVNTLVPYADMGDVFLTYKESADRPELVALAGEVPDRCQIERGLPAVFQAMADDLTEAGFGGATILSVDIFSSLWLFGDFQRLPGGAPWYYGGAPGLDAATHVLMPDCPVLPRVQKILTEHIEKADISLVEVRRTPLYILYRKE